MEQLIEELVNPRSHSDAKHLERVQREIQRLQREPSGWQLGLELLNKSSTHFRFYGALTLTIKIRTDWAFLETQHDLRERILSSLIASYVDFTIQSEQPFVLRKVCSTLAAFFLHPNSSWKFPVRDVLASLCQGQRSESERICDFRQTWARFERISPLQLRSALWLSSSLVEEVSKIDVKGVESANMVEKITTNAADVWHLTFLTLRTLHLRKGQLDSTAPFVPDYLSSCSESELWEISKEALHTASTWISFQPSYFSYGDWIMDMIDATVSLILGCFPMLEIAHETISCLTSTVQQAPNYLKRAGSERICQLLTSQQAEWYVQQLIRGHFDLEATQFVNLVVSLLDWHDLSSPDSFQDHALKIVLIILKNLLYTPGTPVIVDPICQIVLDAFNQVADRLCDWVGTDPADQSLKDLVNEACMQYANKVQYPAREPNLEGHSWDHDERAQFQDFRNDVQDLLLASYACIGPELVANLAAPLLFSGTASTWEVFEARLFCIGALSDVISNNIEVLGEYISNILTSQSWNYLLGNVDRAPDRARQGAINFISRNTSILQQDHRHLLPCIDFLFASLHLPESTTSASRAISVLCHRQRSMLVEGLPQFFNAISVTEDIPPEERHRLFGAIGAIIQATAQEDDKMDALVRILKLISQPQMVNEAAPGDGDEHGLVHAIDHLQTLAATGKGLRAPPEASIDVDSQPSPQEQRFWIAGRGRHVQQLVQNAIDRALAQYPDEPLLIEAACDILKSGYTESHPSPFKFNAEYSASFFSRKLRLNTPRIGLILDTTSSFLASSALNTERNYGDFIQVTSAITRNQRALLDAFAADLRYDDHEFTHSSLECFTRMLPKHGYYFGDKSMSADWQTLFEFALLALENSDTLPRRCSAQFWAAVFEYSPSLPQSAAYHLGECIQHYGPRFIATLRRLLSGGAARSELDVLCEPLRKLVAKQGVLGATLLREGMTSGSGSGEEDGARRFVDQIINLRGAKKTGEVVKEFWVGSRGTAFAYAG